MSTCLTMKVLTQMVRLAGEAAARDDIGRGSAALCRMHGEIERAGGVSQLAEAACSDRLSSTGQICRQADMRPT